MVSKFDTGNIKWCIYGITHLEITYVSVKCKPLQGESGKGHFFKHLLSKMCSWVKLKKQLELRTIQELIV